MKPDRERDWTAQIVIAFEHAGLKPYGKALEYEIRRVLARVDDPKIVRSYVTVLVRASQEFL